VDVKKINLISTFIYLIGRYIVGSLAVDLVPTVIVNHVALRIHIREICILTENFQAYAQFLAADAWDSISH
jgi:hypothetical protein